MLDCYWKIWSGALAIQIKKSELEYIKSILHSLLPNAKILIFGSRSRQTARKFSDIDIAIDNGSPLPLEILSKLEEQFSESDLPFKVDLIDYNRVSQEFKDFILKEAQQL